MSKPSYVSKIQIIGLYRKFDINIEDLKPGINILHGENGIGKTTLLHILANALNSDFNKFKNLEFNCIRIDFDNEDYIEIRNEERSDLILKRSDRRRITRISKLDSPNSQNSTTSNGNELTGIEDITATFSYSTYKPLITAAYFPAFRVMMDAWAIPNLKIEIERELEKHLYSVPNSEYSWQSMVSYLARNIFGEFVPKIDYPSISDIDRDISGRLISMRESLTRFTQKTLLLKFESIFSESFVPESADDLKEVTELLEEVRELTDLVRQHPLQYEDESESETPYKLDLTDNTFLQNSSDANPITKRILVLYCNSLRKVIQLQNQLYLPIHEYLSAINMMLKGKEVTIDFSEATTGNSLLKLADGYGDKFGNLKNLSSGERQVLTLLYTITQMSPQKVVLIDEPEISIHVDSQPSLLEKISALSGDKQIIACTHAPRMASKQLDRLKKVILTPTNIEHWKIDETYDFDRPSDAAAAEEDYELAEEEEE